MPQFVHARIDTFLRGAGGVDLTLERAAAFLAAGADGIFAPGAVDPETVKQLADGVDAPLNAMAGPGALPVAEPAAHALVRRAAREPLGAGTYDAPADGLDYGELNTSPGR
ncbi:isocitrate lyase/phosphoenolpyruvate mutase family protein [Streptomyces sp. MMG1533]|uniref:isocitrate lyase/phosphoenolpyruvate mutase family protein n=1 Tax=Streptomyces sp. MMG1533 TaxID=1415546 RepID=UPI000A8F3F18|nr:isocitrate lyase/phosphoenolpyruvate mutase family protein [Streptomyces sp. MMG1533]